jgi:hypothetical protein
MTHEFYGATMRAILEVNKLLNLPAAGNEQDWEFEFAPPEKIQEILNLFVHCSLDDECQSALALLMIASIEEAGALESNDRENVIKWFSSHEKIREQMYFYWIKLNRSESPKIISELLGRE